MASFLKLSSIFLAILLTSWLVSPAYSLTCTSQTFTGNAKYANCTDLPVLNSFLHWSYNPANSSLSIVFIATPPKSEGWVSWAINPTGTGMVGSQALLAYKESNGSMVVKTYNISSYKSIVESKLSFDVLDKKAEYSNGSMRIFATLSLPKNMVTLNQVWQAGASVKDGIPTKHDFSPDNLNSKGTLELAKTQGNSASASAAPSPAPSGDKNDTGSGKQSSNDSGGRGGRVWNGGLGFSGFLLLVGILVLGW